MAINQRGLSISTIQQKDIPLTRVYQDSFLVYVAYRTYNLDYYATTWGINSITVSRTSSPRAGAYTGTLYPGDRIYTKDVLDVTITTSASNYYVYNTSTKDLTSYNYQIVVDNDVTIEAKAVVRKSYVARVTTGNIGMDTPEGIRYVGTGSVSVTNGFTSGVFEPWSQSLLNDKIVVSDSTSTTINYRGESVNPNTTVRGTIYYYNYAPLMYAPEITNVNNYGNYFVFNIYNYNDVALEFFVSYSYDDSSSGQVQQPEYSVTTIGSHTSYTYYINSSTGAEIMSLNFSCRFYYASASQYSEETEYDY